MIDTQGSLEALSKYYIVLLVNDQGNDVLVPYYLVHDQYWDDYQYHKKSINILFAL